MKNTIIASMSGRRDRQEPKKRGRPAKAGDHQPFSLRIPTELHQQLKHYRVDHPETSINDLIVAAIERWWNSVPERQKYAKLVEDAAKRRAQ